MKILPAITGRPERPLILLQGRSKHYELAYSRRLIGAVNAINGLAKIRGTSPKRVAFAASHETRQIRLPLDHFGRRHRPVFYVPSVSFVPWNAVSPAALNRQLINGYRRREKEGQNHEEEHPKSGFGDRTLQQRCICTTAIRQLGLANSSTEPECFVLCDQSQRTDTGRQVWAQHGHH